MLAVASQRAMRWGGPGAGVEERQRQERALRDMLARGAAVLSPRVSRLLSPGPVQQAPGPDGAVDGAAPPAPVAPLVARRRRDVALGELVAIAVDPNVSQFVEPTLENQPDKVAPRLRRVGEISLRAPRVILQGDVRERLSEETRALVDQIAPNENDLLTVIDVLDRSSLVSVQVAAMIAALPNDPTAGFPPGAGALRRPADGAGQATGVRGPGERTK